MTGPYLQAAHRSSQRVAAIAIVLALMLAAVPPASAEMVAREIDIAVLRLGQRVLVDDGSCTQGQIKEVTGAKLSAAGVERSRKCIERKGARR